MVIVLENQMICYLRVTTVLIRGHKGFLKVRCVVQVTRKSYLTYSENNKSLKVGCAPTKHVNSLKLNV